jgi:hypothetical protein
MSDSNGPSAITDYPDKVYDTKRDTWIVVILWFVVVISLGGAVGIFFSTAPWYIMLFQGIVFIGLGLLCISILRSTNYTLSGNELFVRTGLIHWTISIDGIEEVIPSRKAWSAAQGLSMDRLYIKHEETRSKFLISPEEKQAFLEDLARRSPYLHFEVDRVVRRDVGE